MPYFILGYIAYLNISIGYKKKLICMQTKGCIQRKKIINISNYLDKIQNHIMTSKLHLRSWKTSTKTFLVTSFKNIQMNKVKLSKT